MIPGPTRYATSRIHDVVSSFHLFFTPDMIQIILDMTNLQRRRSVTGWIDVDATELRAYMGLLILAGVYRSRGESSLSLWDDYNGRAVFRATMSHKRYKMISSCLRLDDHLSRPSRHRRINWLQSGPFGKCAHIGSLCCLIRAVINVLMSGLCPSKASASSGSTCQVRLSMA